MDPMERAAAQVLIRCTYAERDALREAAERAGAPLSEWIRDTCLRAARRTA